MLGLSEEESEITIEHCDDGLSSTEFTYIQALWQIKKQEESRKKK